MSDIYFAGGDYRTPPTDGELLFHLNRCFAAGDYDHIPMPALSPAWFNSRLHQIRSWIGAYRAGHVASDKSTTIRNAS